MRGKQAIYVDDTALAYIAWVAKLSFTSFTDVYSSFYNSHADAGCTLTQFLGSIVIVSKVPFCMCEDNWLDDAIMWY